MRIKEISSYFPSLTLDTKFNRRIRGKRRIVNYDEDTVTMGVEVSSYIESVHKKNVMKVTFVSSSHPFTERSSAGIISTVFDIEHDVKAVDVTCDEAGAVDVLSGAGSKEIIVISDAKRYEVNSAEFYNTGHGAVSVFMDEEGWIEIVSSFSYRMDSLMGWRNDGEVKGHTAESKAIFVLMKEVILETIETVLNKGLLSKEKVWKVYLGMRDQKSAYSVLKSAGFSDEQIWKSTIYGDAGYTGPPHILLELTDMIEKENPEDKFILLAGIGSGVSAVLLHTLTDPSRCIKRGIKEALRGSISCDSDTVYRILGYLPYEKVKPFSPHTLYQRDIEQFLKLKAQRCKRCGVINYPWKFVCYKCKSAESFELVSLSKDGRVYTYTLDYLNPGPIQPVVMSVVDLEGGGRFYGQMIDVKPEDVSIGMRAKLVLRKLHEGGDFVNYFWKLKPWG